MTGKYKKGLALGIFCCGVIILRVFYITRTYGPIVYADEIGYWGHAANLTGNMWMGVMDKLPWYGFGYSLLLVPFFELSHNMVIMYRGAVLLNALLGLCSFALAYIIAKKTTAVSDITAGLFAFVSVSYSAYIFHSYVAWSETLLSFLIWLILYETIVFEDTPGFLKGFLLGITTGFGYMVHNRMLVILGAVLVVVLLLLWKRKIKGLHLFGVLLGILLVSGLYILMKRYLQDGLFSNEMAEKLGIEFSFSTANTLSDQIYKLGQFFSFEGIKCFLLNFIGQIWQILSATYFLAGFGVFYCVRGLISAYTRKERISIYLLPIIMLLFTMAMTGFFFIEEGGPASGSVRIDTFFYGRYNESIIGPFLMWGLLYLSKFKTGSNRDIAGLAAVYLLTGFGVYYRIKNISDFYLNVGAAVSTYTFHWLGEFAVWKCTVICIIVIFVILIIRKWEMPYHIEKYIICGLLLGLFSLTALKCMKLVIRGENDNTLRYQRLYSYLLENTQGGKEEFIYTLEKEKFAYDLQTRVVDRPVIVYPIEKCDQIEAGHFLVMKETDFEEIDTTEWTVNLIYDGYIILQKEGD